MTRHDRDETLARRRLESERDEILAREQAARREAEEANRTKDEFLAMVSHELRTPLNAMLGWLRLLRSGALPEEKRARALDTIERNARIQAQLVDDLLDVSRIIAGKLRIEPRATDLAVVVEAAADAVRPLAKAKQVEIEIVREDDLGVTSGDPDRLQQVVWNLASNAIKFTPARGVVQITLGRAAGAFTIRVRDTGEGIAPEFLPYVFDRFRQADAARNRRHGGLGLGLAITKHLVELHGGAVKAESDGLGKGATFTVTLPVPALRSDVDEATPVSVPRGLGAHLLDGVSVLVVEDQDDARELLATVLEQEGASVRVACSADEARAALEERPPDVIVSDIGMPIEDGYALLRSVRALPVELGGDVPAIALTAFARGEDRRRALEAGFQLHVAKPADPGHLASLVRKLAKKRHAA